MKRLTVISCVICTSYLVHYRAASLFLPAQLGLSVGKPNIPVGRQIATIPASNGPTHLVRFIFLNKVQTHSNERMLLRDS